MQILRHAQLDVTMEMYVSASSAATQEAPKRLGSQRVQVGLRYAGQTVTIELDETTLRIYDQHDHLIEMFPAPAARRLPTQGIRSHPRTTTG